MASLKTFLAFVAISAAGAVHGQSLDLSRVPPSINAALPPNLLVTLDDSGSMAFGFTPDLLGFTATGANRGCFWRHPQYYSAHVNKQYFDPNITYTPPKRADGTSFPNASFTAARIDGFDGTSTTYNLSTGYRVTVSMAHGGPWVTHSALTTTTTTPMGAGCTSAYNSTSNKTARFPFENAAFYYDFTPNSSYSSGSPDDQRNYTARQVSTAQRQNFANWFSYYRTRLLTSRSALTLAFDDMNPANRVAWQNYHQNQIGTSTEIKALDATDGTYADWKGRFFNWIHNSPADGGTPMRASLIRGGQFFERGGASQLNARNPYYDPAYGRELSCRQNFHIMVTDGYWNGTIPSTAPSIGNYDGTATTFPDGRAYSTSAAASRVFWNVASGGTAAPNLADIAFYFWARDLRADLTNDVPIHTPDTRTGVVTGASAGDEIYFNPANDPGNWQRVVSYFVGFGLGGTLEYDTSGSCVDNPSLNVPNLCQGARLTRLRRGDDIWPAATSGQSNTLDDAWHAALNSRGQFLSAQDPQELVDSLNSVLDNVSRRQGVTGSAGSTAFLRTDTVQFEASYDSGSWAGDIQGRQINPETGLPTDVFAWSSSAGAQLDARTPASRRILFNRAASGPATTVEFQWGNLSGAQQTILNRNPLTGTADALGTQRVAWIRGARNVEQGTGGVLRQRSTVLGPFIGSSLINVAAPRFGYRGRSDFAEGGTQYARFRQDNRDRPATLYIGSNDGMLHAFNAETGAERWAFIPNRVFANLGRLTVPEYQFVPFVNNTPIDHDVYFGGRWRTVLVGTLGLGGQGVYAIDVSNPDSPTVLWEFTDEGDAMLGYTYGRPNVVRLSDGTWVAMVPAGYNSEATVDYATRGLPNERADAHAHAGGNSTGAVFAINIATGQARRINVTAARGLATVQAADYELDYKVDFLVAGDLNGDLYRIDLQDRTWDNVASAPVDLLFRGNRVTGVPQRPITTAPTIYADPSSGKMTIVVGTGKFIENSDREINIPRQAIYGIRECGQGCSRYPITQATLVEQTLTAGTGGFLNMSQTNVVPQDRDGWFVQIGNPSLMGGALRGERVIEMSVPVSFASGIVALGSFIPSNDPCSPLGTGAIYVLSAFTGGFPLPGDLNTGGTAYLPGQGVLGGGAAGSVGTVTNRPPDLSAFLDPDGGSMSLMGQKILGVPVRRRSGWREIPLE